MKILVSVVFSPLIRERKRDVGFIPTDPSSKDNRKERRRKNKPIKKIEELFFLIIQYLLKLLICFTPSMIWL